MAPPFRHTRTLLSLMAGVGRVPAVPSTLPQLRDAMIAAPTHLFDDGNRLWNAETVCRVAVYAHREARMRDQVAQSYTRDS